MADVIGHGDDSPRGSRAGVVIGVAAAVALVALFVMPQRGRDDATPAPRPTPTSATADPVPAPSRRPIGDLDGPQRTAPTGLHVFARQNDELFRLDVDGGGTALISGLGDVKRHHLFAQPWGSGAAIVRTPIGEGGDTYESTLLEVFLLRRGAERVTRIGTAHELVRGADAGTLVLVRRRDGRSTMATTYDERGRRLASRTVPADQHVVADSAAGLITQRMHERRFELLFGGRTRDFPGRSLLGATSTVAISSELPCEIGCSVWVTDLESGAERRLPLRGHGSVVDVAISPRGTHALVRAAVTDANLGVIGENVYFVDLRVQLGGVTEVVGAQDVGPLHRVEWVESTGGAFLQSNLRWAFWTPCCGLELLESRAGFEIVGVA